MLRSAHRTKLRNAMLLVAAGVLAGLLSAEGMVRLAGRYDQNGNFILHGRALRPLRLPLVDVLKETEIYEKSPTRLRYDPVVGWSPRPNYRSRDGLYAYNAMGFRVDPSAPREYSSTPAGGVLRIVLIGDSFTHGDDVPYAETWGHLLERQLAEAGMPAEVVNLGVGGYGMDQAFLRWKQSGRNLSPQLVLLGLQMENVVRNVNVIRPLYNVASGFPFSKPRYVLRGDGLALLNMPTMPPRETAAVLRWPLAWSLAPHEHFLQSRMQEAHPPLHSVLWALTAELISPEESDPFFYDLDREPAQLALRLLETFRADIERSGSRFVAVHIPTLLDLVRLRLKRSLVYADLLAAMEKRVDVVCTERELLEEAGWSRWHSLFTAAGHYTARGNAVIAAVATSRVGSAILSSVGGGGLGPSSARSGPP